MKNSQFLTSKELEERWQIKEIDLFAMVKKKVINCVTVSNDYIDWQSSPVSTNDFSWNEFPSRDVSDTIRQ